MKHIKLIRLEEETDFLREDILTEDDITLLKQLRVGKFFEIS